MMRQRGMALRRIVATTIVLVAAVCGLPARAQTPDGKKLFDDARKGNCGACHAWSVTTPASVLPAIGPSLVGVKARYADRKKLRDVIRDASALNPDTVMPPYGRHRILTDVEINAIAGYVETL
jgi:sulfur-oxidizing protein SoxX